MATNKQYFYQSSIFESLLCNGTENMQQSDSGRQRLHCRNGTISVVAPGRCVGCRPSVYDMNNQSLITKFVITGFSAI